MYYKVLKQTKQGLRSCTDYAPVTYAVGRWTQRPQGCGPLACFDDLSTAAWYCLWGGDTIYTCEIMPSADTRLWDYTQDSCTPTIDTVLADRVKLVARIL